MANRKPLQYPRFQAWDDDETFLNGGTITFYEAGSTNKRAIYQDADLTVQAPNPVTLNSRGEPEANDGTPIDIYIDENPYKVALKDSSGTTVHTIDNYVNVNYSTANVQFVALDLGDDDNDESSGLDRISIVNDTNSIATESVADELNFDMSKNWPTADDVPDSAIDHDQTTNFVANEHVDHTTVNITAGAGLAGGGDITATRTLNLDINPLTTVTLSGSDEVAVGDVSDTNNIKKVTAQDIADLGASSATALPQDPENATDGGTDAYASETTTSTPAAGTVRSRDFQSANTTTTPTLDGITLVDKDGNALWAGAINGLHLIKYDGTNYRVKNPIGTDANVNNAPVSRDASGRAKFADPSAAQDAVTYGVLGAEKISSGAFSGASVDISIPSGHDEFALVLSDVKPDTDAVNLVFRTSSDGGATFDSGAAEYQFQTVLADAGSVSSGRSDDSALRIVEDLSNATDETASAILWIHLPRNDSARTHYYSHCSFVASDGNITMRLYSSQKNSASSDDTIRLLLSSGNFSQGIYTLYGTR